MGRVGRVGRVARHDGSVVAFAYDKSHEVGPDPKHQLRGRFLLLRRGRRDIGVGDSSNGGGASNSGEGCRDSHNFWTLTSHERCPFPEPFGFRLNPR